VGQPQNVGRVEQIWVYPVRSLAGTAVSRVEVSTRGLAGEKYVDGVSLEHPANGVNAFHLAYAKKRFGNLGQRRVLIIAKNATEARAWAATGAVTHVSPQVSAQYKYPTAPVVSFRALNDR